jgi:hypothetical protein
MRIAASDELHTTARVYIARAEHSMHAKDYAVHVDAISTHPSLYEYLCKLLCEATTTTTGDA